MLFQVKTRTWELFPENVSWEGERPHDHGFLLSFPYCLFPFLFGGGNLLLHNSRSQAEVKVPKLLLG